MNTTKKESQSAVLEKYSIFAWLFISIGLCGLTMVGCSKTSPEILRADYHDIDWLPGDCSYHGATMGSNGSVYFSVSTHVAGASARMFEFDPTDREVRLLCKLEDVIPQSNAVTQGKLHAPITEWKGELFSCTHTAWYFENLRDPVTGHMQTPYPGGYVLAFKTADGTGRVVAKVLHEQPVTAALGKERVPMDGEGLITNVLDTQREVMYVGSWPSSILMKVDITTGESKRLANLQEKGETVNPGDPGYGKAVRTLALDGSGNVYWSNAKGEIWKYDPETEQSTTMKTRMESATRIPLPSGRPDLNLWRTIVWDEPTQAFYGVHWGTSWLFKYDPEADSMDPLGPWRADHMREAESNTDYAQLGLTIGPDRRLYGFVHAPPTKEGLLGSVHLLTYDLEDKLISDRGEIRSVDDKAMIYAESCAVGQDGDVYTVGWTEPPVELETELRELRRQGPDETIYHPYLISLVRISGKDIKSQ